MYSSPPLISPVHLLFKLEVFWVINLRITPEYNFALNILNDTTYYKKIGRDPTSTEEQKVDKIIYKLRDDNIFIFEENKHLLVFIFRFSKFYGLPKIHKPISFFIAFCSVA